MGNQRNGCPHNNGSVIIALFYKDRNNGTGYGSKCFIL